MIDVVTDVRGFEQLRDRWAALLEGSGSWNPFITWQWMWAWWTHLADGATLHIITVTANDQLVAIAPLMSVRRGISAPRRLEFIGAGSGADYVDLIVRSGCEVMAIDALARYLESQQLALHLDNLPPNSLALRLWRHLATTGWTAIEGSPDVCPFANLSGHTWDSYLATLGPAHRANVRRRIRAIHSQFDARFAPVASDEARREALEALFAFHDQRWRDRGGSSAFGSAAHRAFHHDLTRRALESGSLRLFALHLGDRLAGVMYGFAQRGRFYFYQHGSDAALAASSLGVVLMALTIRAAIDEGLGEFDMLYGHEAYKKLWAGDERPLTRLMVFPPRLAGRWLQRRAETRRAVGAFVRRIGLRGSHEPS